MTWRLKVLAALTEDLGSLAQLLHCSAQLPVTSVSRGRDAVFRPPWVPGMHVIPVHTCRHSHIHTQNK